ncbi:MAG: DUF1553 domain-containing protein, partial [Planctomycetaceae bacterium]|nr:DUF1553 domain-containing protein [Planctomycetaceae bacterium]
MTRQLTQDGNPVRALLPRAVGAFVLAAGALLSGGNLYAGSGYGATPDQPSQVDQPAKLEVSPAEVKLHGFRARQQLVLTGFYASDIVRDLTHAATWESSDPNVVKVVGTMLHPTGDGTATVTATAGGLTSTMAVTVTAMGEPSPVSFHDQTQSALTKAGCNMGACHGSPSGKAGFRLSLRAFDPPLDILTLRTEFYGRRVNPMDPAESLLLKKPLMEIAHGGGRRLSKDDPAYRVIHDWIAEGLQLDPPDHPEVVKVTVFPESRILREGSPSQQLRVDAHFSDGTVKDVTELTVFTSSNESVGTVNESGLIDKTGRGETAILAIYCDTMVTSYITFLEDVEGFAWTNPPTTGFIDELVMDKLHQLQILPSELCSDEEFLRRAYLDTTGRLPTVAESREFLDDSSSDRRAKLIDRLLESEDFASFWTLKWGDILRSNSKKLTDTGVHKFRRWIYDSVYSDKPLDEFARELLTASGSVSENPPANFWRASRDPNDATETTAQLFLGIRIQCAKCHNHPFEKWSQDNYYGIAAAFTRIGRKKGSLREDDEVIFPTTTGEIKQPRTGETMKVHLLLKGDVDVPNEEDRRVVFAEWLTAPENPFFAKAAVNRIWGHLLGRGIVEPVDDFRDSNPPSNALLLDELTRQFVENNYSRKWAIRTIMNSRVYQLSSRKNQFNTEDELYNSHASTRLLSAEQLLDAICQATGVPENFKGLPPGTRAVELPDPPTDHYFLKIFGQPQREMACQCERSTESNLSQALQMINGPVVHNKLRADNGRIATAIKEGKKDAEIISSLYLAALCREPVAEEMDAALKHVAASENRRQALEDVGWAVL